MEKTKSFVIPEPNEKLVKVKIKADTPLICYQFSEKAKKQMREIMGGVPKRGKRPPRTPERIMEEYKDSVYRTKSGYLGFPARNIKNAMVRAAKNVGLAMTDMKTLFWIFPEEDDLIYLRINDKKLKKMEGCQMREDPVRVGKGGTDLRYRAMLTQWEMEFTIRYDADALTPEAVLNLVRRAGRGGLGEWRPTAPKNPGDFGMFDISN